MKVSAVCLAAFMLLLFLGCGSKESVVLLKGLPEVDHSAIDHLMEYEGAEVSEDRLFVVVKEI